MSPEDMKLVRDEIKAGYALPIRDFLDHCYRSRFPHDTSARVAFALGHYNFFLNALSRPGGDLAPYREILTRLCARFDCPPEVLDEVSLELVFELMKMTAFQRRHSPDAIAACHLVIALAAHALWSGAAERGQRRVRAA